MRRWYPMLAGVMACAVLLLDNDVILAREDDQPKPSESSDQQSPSPDEKEAIDLLRAALEAVEAPTEQLERLGIA